MSITPQVEVKFQGSYIRFFAYVDDLVIMEESQRGLRFLLCRLEKAVLKVRLYINEQKTVYIVVA